LASRKELHRQVVAYALSLPGAWEDQPWNETVAKVGKKVFAFFGDPDGEYGPGMTVKLYESHDGAVGVPGAEEAGYGLGRSGWVTIQFGPKTPSLGVLTDWVEESYRLVAPKRLAQELDARPEPGTDPAPVSRRAQARRR
jgi:predicted DNA-binding protein (MmcQ/YjbR family)